LIASTAEVTVEKAVIRITAVSRSHLPDAAEDLHAVRIRQLVVEEDEVRFLLVQGPQALFATARFRDLIALPGEALPEGHADQLLVLDDEDLLAAHAATSDAQGSAMTNAAPPLSELAALDGPPVREDDVAHDGQAQAGALGLGGEEGLEDLLQRGGGDARTRSRRPPPPPFLPRAGWRARCGRDR
jgi:hypothetical protein